MDEKLTSAVDELLQTFGKIEAVNTALVDENLRLRSELQATRQLVDKSIQDLRDYLTGELTRLRVDHEKLCLTVDAVVLLLAVSSGDSKIEHAASRLRDALKRTQRFK